MLFGVINVKGYPVATSIKTMCELGICFMIRPKGVPPSVASIFRMQIQKPQPPNEDKSIFGSIGSALAQHRGSTPHVG